MRPWLGNASRMAPCRCPFCGKQIDAATPGPFEPVDAKPQRLDFTVCIGCVAILVFDGEPLGLRKPTEDELHEAAGMFPAQLVQVALGHLKAKERQ